MTTRKAQPVEPETLPLVLRRMLSRELNRMHQEVGIYDFRGESFSFAVREVASFISQTIHQTDTKSVIKAAGKAKGITLTGRKIRAKGEIQYHLELDDTQDYVQAFYERKLA